MFACLRYVALFLLVIGCSSPTTLYPSASREEVLREQRVQEELLEHAQGNNEEEVLLDEASRIDQYYRLRRVGGRIKSAALSLCQHNVFQNKPCDFEFVVLLKRGVNAFADGQKIYVSMDMLNFADTDEQLALVLGHEYAHNIMRHVKSQKTNTLLGTLFGTALDITAGSLTGIGTGSIFRRIGGRAGQLAYSKPFEKEADYIGLYITALASYTIDDAASFWRRMSIKHPKSIYIATTHPTNPERYVGLKKAVEEIDQKKMNGQMLVPNIKAVRHTPKQ